ncbi:MAG: hypothetical protein QXV58_14410 [Saccharolobus sp.]|uniref:hypothetical protein n=1 Tax=Saccharolobus sp. TaxID=2100761 RepID=UPI003165DE4E
MPSGVVHTMLEKKLLGYTNRRLQSLMDSTWKIKGPKHREDFHDLQSIILLSLIAGGDMTKNIQAGLLHVTADKVFSSYKKKLIKQGIPPAVADLLIYEIVKNL